MKKVTIIATVVLLAVPLFLSGCLEENIVSVNIDGSAMSEASVGDKVEWKATINNTGDKSISPLTLNCDYGGMDLVAISPEPLELPIEACPRFKELKPGESIDVTFYLLAKKVGVAKGFVSADGSEKILHLQTIIR